MLGQVSWTPHLAGGQIIWFLGPMQMRLTVLAVIFPFHVAAAVLLCTSAQWLCWLVSLVTDLGLLLHQTRAYVQQDESIGMKTSMLLCFQHGGIGVTNDSARGKVSVESNFSFCG
ncbi:unnamed protein product [Ostreobium quekettii]|uniref:Uncharacterized protein n=1 Tax=Ostreobium quekettii TaxID=121088 RepID=A0A8S1J820_9CHLO|nr:unnamed protein product [Ostreobium quekettii]